MDELVRQYLIKRGANSTLNEFDKELKAGQQLSSGGRQEGTATQRYIMSNTTMMMAPQTPRPQTVLTPEELIVWGLHDGEPSKYKEGYESFRNWAYGSLELFKPELIALCFPIFVVSYISLIRHGFGDAARELWEVGALDHRDFYPVEISTLAMLTASEQLQSKEFLTAHPFINAAQQNKFKLKLSTMVANLLNTFLAQNNFLLIAAIVNDKIWIERSQQLLPTDDTVRKPELKDYASEAASSRPVSGLPHIHLGIPGIPAPYGNVTYPEYRTDDVYSTWMKAIVLRKVFAKSAAEAKAKNSKGSKNASNSSSSSKSSTERELQEGDPLEPSVLFATFTNVNDGLICLKMDKEVKQAVGGFRDSCVRIWDIKERDSPTDSREFTTILPWRDASSTLPAPGSASSALPKDKVASAGRVRPRDEGQNVIELRGHSKPVYAVSQSSDLQHVVSASSDLTIRLWDVAKRHCLGKYRCMMPSWDVDFSPYDYYFASANMDRTLTLYSTDRLEPLRIMSGHTSDVTCCRWHGNASLIATGSDDKTCRFWDVRNGNSVRVLAGSHAPISCIAVSPTGGILVGGSDSGAIYLWDINSGSQMALLRGHSGPVHSIAFSSAGDTIVSGGADCSMKIWDISGSIADAKEKLVLKPGLTTYPAPRAGTEAESVPTIQPAKNFATKLSPVFFADYTRENLVFGGGPFSIEGIPSLL